MAEVERRGSVAAVAKRHGVRERTLSWWRWNLRHEKRPRERRSKPRLLPVVVSAVPSDASSAMLEVRVGDVVLRLGVGTDVQYVAAVVNAVRPTC